eukprot:TRINITY_DN10244_c0_g1_i1.p1 TRINITY_DN10244_c0_g1~~TRINITY_DN10244_c0_g1_i1.p1  ORF type:complete len:205 (-),score=53.73 TRINITY_DN10244_c0_g1_i1:47-622(-)
MAQQVDRRKKAKRVIDDNVMRNISIDKIVVNICVGASGDPLVRAKKVLYELTGQVGVSGKARLTVRNFGIRRNEEIGVSTTVRGTKAMEILEKALKVKEYELLARNFSDTGNFGFGIREHIDLGIKYDPSVGIYGMDIYVVLSRPGFRVARRKRAKARVGKNHKVTKDEAKQWFRDTFDGHISNRTEVVWY